MILVNTQEKLLTIGPQSYPCRIGRKGTIPAQYGREGDEKTPLGQYNLRFGLYRADRLPKPNSPLNFLPLRPDDGWCDDPNDPAYNRFIRIPVQEAQKTPSHENLWREDGAYDIILVISHNDNPPIGGDDSALGSAVFIHIAQADDRQTLGCIALSPDCFVKILKRLKTGQVVTIF